MSDRILKALMQLFALISRVDVDYLKREAIVKEFLLQQLSADLVEEYLKFFSQSYNQYEIKKKKSPNKYLSFISVKVIRISSEINQSLTLQQKVITLLRLLEFVKDREGYVTQQEHELLEIVSDAFYIDESEYTILKEFVTFPFNKIPQSSRICLIDNKDYLQKEKTLHYKVKDLDGQIRILFLKDADMYLVRYFNIAEISMNAQPIQADRVYIINPGGALRHPKVTSLYYSDIVSIFHRKKLTTVSLESHNIVYKFKSGSVGINKMSFAQETGQLVGIMGASGSGKSTLINVLNGSYVPSEGNVTVNGVDVHKDKDKIEGLIGYVSQDDLLINSLTVFENLYFNAKLCFGTYSKSQLTKVTVEMLKSLGLYGIKDMKVGNPLDKKISGGQRKRLNIALELIRQPTILFLDEPTSGLSSNDSENIMDILKELTRRGKLIYVVIHQPSSDIFKMFDRLILLDIGGRLIYSGEPIDSIIHFKSLSHHLKWNESECHSCGNVNPEQIFKIVEAKILDEQGNPTLMRKNTPEDWERHYLSTNKDNVNNHSSNKSKDIPESLLNIPNKFKQFIVLVQRDILAKIANRQYMFVNIFEAPLLSFFLAYLIKFFNVNAHPHYLFNNNVNLPVYIFMSVIVAIFMGLTISAEEIIKDRLILKREEFLNLSWNIYLLAKICILVIISAVQAFLFVSVGNYILEIKGMYFHYWLILFSSWIVAALFGLNISNAFKTSVTVYILIPFLVIPNIILSGIMVKYEKLNPQITKPGTIPFYGELILARWAYEALATYQFTENKYNKNFYKYDKVISNANFKKHYWLTAIQNKLNFINLNYPKADKKQEVTESLLLVKQEIEQENNYFASKTNNKNYIFNDFSGLSYDSYSQASYQSLKNYLSNLKKYYILLSKKAEDKRDALMIEKQKTPELKKAFIELKQNYHNEALSKFVENRDVLNAIIQYDNRLYQKIDPIYQDPETNFILAHFYAPYKKVFGLLLFTYWVNLMVLWFIAFVLYISLYFNWFKRIVAHLEKIINNFIRE